MNVLLRMSLVQDMVDSNTTLYSMHDLIIDYLGQKYSTEEVVLCERCKPQLVLWCF